MPIFGVRNLTLNQCLGSVNNNKEKIQYIGPTNLKKGRTLQFCSIRCCGPFHKYRSA